VLEIGGQKYKFTLDTGAVGGRISSEVVQRLHLKPVAKIMVGDPSGKNSREVSSYRLPEVKAGKATLYGVRMMEMPGIGNESDGVIGYAAFYGLLLTLDYPKHEVVISPGGMTKDQEGGAIRYSLNHGLVTLPVQIGDVRVDGHVDSGSDGSLSIPARFKSQLRTDGEPRLLGHARSLFNSFDIYSVKVKDPILVGGMKMPINSVEYHDMWPFSNIGGRLLKNFRVSIDQKKKLILFANP
jgi:hypothetical protein